MALGSLKKSKNIYQIIGSQQNLQSSYRWIESALSYHQIRALPLKLKLAQHRPTQVKLHTI